jgi:hypothetical protein
MYDANKFAKLLRNRKGWAAFFDDMILNMRSKSNKRPRKEYKIIIMGLWETFYFIRYDK